MKKKIKAFDIWVSIGMLVALFSIFWLTSPPRIEVRPLNKSPRQAADCNLKILPPEKRDKIYLWLIIVRDNFRGKEYAAKFSEDATTVATSNGDVCARIYTQNPDKERLKKYM